MTKRLKIREYLAVISEPNRFAILTFLKKGEKCACEIHPELNIPQNLTSHHLKVLKDFNLLKNRRNGTKILYSRNNKLIKDYQLELTRQIDSLI